MTENAEQQGQLLQICSHDPPDLRSSGPVQLLGRLNPPCGPKPAGAYEGCGLEVLPGLRHRPSRSCQQSGTLGWGGELRTGASNQKADPRDVGCAQTAIEPTPVLLLIAASRSARALLTAQTRQLI